MALSRKPTMSEIQVQVDYIIQIIRDGEYSRAQTQIALLEDAGCENVAMDLGRKLLDARRDSMRI